MAEPKAPSKPVAALTPDKAAPASKTPVETKAAVVAKPADAPAKPVAAATPPTKSVPPKPQPAAIKPAPAKAPVPVAKPKAAVAVKPVPAPTVKAPSPVPAAKPAAPVSVKPVPPVLPTPPAPMKGLAAMATTASTAFPTPPSVQALIADMQTRAKDSMAKSAKLVEEMSDFAKGNVEAVMASSRVAAKGAETLGAEAADYGKKSFESAATAFKGMVAAKSPTELFKLQSDYARTSFDAAVAEGSKLSEAWLKLFGEIAQPLSSRVAIAAEKIKAPLAS